MTNHYHLIIETPERIYVNFSNQMASNKELQGRFGKLTWDTFPLSRADPFWLPLPRQVVLQIVGTKGINSLLEEIINTNQVVMRMLYLNFYLPPVGVYFNQKKTGPYSGHGLFALNTLSSGYCAFTIDAEP